MGAILSKEITNKKDKHAKNVTTKRTFVYNRSWNKKAEHYLVPFQLGTRTPGDLNLFCRSLHMSTNDYKGTTSTDLGVMNKLKGVGELAKTQSANNEDQLYLPQPLTNVSIQLKGHLQLP